VGRVDALGTPALQGIPVGVGPRLFRKSLACARARKIEREREKEREREREKEREREMNQDWKRRVLISYIVVLYAEC